MFNAIESCLFLVVGTYDCPGRDRSVGFIKHLELSNGIIIPSLLSLSEAITAPSVELLIDGFTFVVPATWNILICDPETSQLDISDVGSVLGKSFHSFVYGFNLPIVELHKIEAVGYVPSHTSFSPSLNKHHMLCHPIDQTRWINLSPADSYNKYFRNTLLSGDLI